MTRSGGSLRSCYCIEGFATLIRLDRIENVSISCEDLAYITPISACARRPIFIAPINWVPPAEPVQVLPALIANRVPRQEPSRAGIVVAVRQAQQPRLRVRVVPKLAPPRRLGDAR